MSRKVNSAGFVIRSLERVGLISNYKYLLCHASGAGDTKGWGIPKGKQDGEENLFITAKREVLEETNFDINKWHKDNTLGASPYVYFTYTLKDKIVSVYPFTDTTGQLINYKFSCPSEYEPGKPEINDYRWVTLQQAVRLATESQKGLFKHIQDHGL